MEQQSKPEEQAEHRSPRPVGKPLIIGKLKLEHWRIISLLMMLYDYMAVMGAYFLALWIRFDGVYSSIPKPYLSAYGAFAPWFALVTIGIFWLCRMYNSMWRYASFSELTRTTIGSMSASALHALGIFLLIRRMPIAYYVLGAIIQFVLVAGIRFGYRFFQTIRKHFHDKKETNASRVMLIGAGSAGQMILRDLTQAKEITDQVVCIIDDNPNKWNRFMEGVPVVGGRDDILWAAKKYNIDKIFLAIPSATAQQKRDILMICNETGCELKQLPGMYQFVLDQISVTSMKKVSVEDLLGREPIRTDMEEVYGFITGKSVHIINSGF